MTTAITTKQRVNFLEAESIATNYAYKVFYGSMPVGTAFVFITDRKAGNPWTDLEKQTANQIANQAIMDLKNIKLAELIADGLVPDCLMARRFMATGSGYNAEGRIQ